MKKTDIFAAFVMGCCVGAAAALFYSKRKYDALMAEEIVPEPDKKEDILEDSDDPPAETTQKSESVLEYARRINDIGYSDKPIEEDYVMAPYVIKPEDFGTIENFREISLNMYSDGVIASDDGEIYDEDMIEDTIGRESLEHISDYEEDVVHVRNEANACDYELVVDPRKYSDIYPGFEED